MKESLISRALIISRVIVRVAASIKRVYLRSKFEELAVDLICFASNGDIDKSIKVISTMKSLIDLSESIYELEIMNGKILNQELNLLESVLRSDLGAKVDVGEMFENANIDRMNHKIDQSLSSDILPTNNNDESAIESAKFNDESAMIADYSATLKYRAERIGNKDDVKLPNESNNAINTIDNDNAIDSDGFAAKDDSPAVSIGTAIRQSAIIEKVRSLSVRDASGNIVGCRMKDLLATFPDVSERTIRNDLQRLLNKGVVERIGGGGASTAYVMK